MYWLLTTDVVLYARTMGLANCLRISAFTVIHWPADRIHQLQSRLDSCRRCRPNAMCPIMPHPCFHCGSGLRRSRFKPGARAPTAWHPSKVALHLLLQVKDKTAFCCWSCLCRCNRLNTFSPSCSTLPHCRRCHPASLASTQSNIVSAPAQQPILVWGIGVLLTNRKEKKVVFWAYDPTQHQAIWLRAKVLNKLPPRQFALFSEV
jgi:hypothetical protein